MHRSTPLLFNNSAPTSYFNKVRAELHLNDSVSLRVRQVTTDIADVNLVGLFCVRVVVHAWGVAVVVGGREVGPHRDLAARVNDHRHWERTLTTPARIPFDGVALVGLMTVR